MTPTPHSAKDDLHRFNCPHCARRLKAKLGHVGRKVTCPSCSRILVVPEPAQCPVVVVRQAVSPAQRDVRAVPRSGSADKRSTWIFALVGLGLCAPVVLLIAIIRYPDPKVDGAGSDRPQVASSAGVKPVSIEESAATAKSPDSAAPTVAPTDPAPPSETPPPAAPDPGPPLADSDAKSTLSNTSRLLAAVEGQVLAELRGWKSSGKIFITVDVSDPDRPRVDFGAYYLRSPKSEGRLADCIGLVPPAEIRGGITGNYSEVRHNTALPVGNLQPATTVEVGNGDTNISLQNLIMSRKIVNGLVGGKGMAVTREPEGAVMCTAESVTYLLLSDGFHLPVKQTADVERGGVRLPQSDQWTLLFVADPIETRELELVTDSGDIHPVRFNSPVEPLKESREEAVAQEEIDSASEEVWEEVQHSGLPVTKAVLCRSDGGIAAFGGTIAADMTLGGSGALQTTYHFDRPSSLFLIAAGGVNWGETDLEEGKIYRINDRQQPVVTRGEYAVWVAWQEPQKILSSQSRNSPAQQLPAGEQIELVLPAGKSGGLHKVRTLSHPRVEGWIEGCWDELAFMVRQQ